MNRVLSRLGLTAVSLVAGSALYAQSSTTGAIAGIVADSNGAPIAGASITLTSSQVTRTATSGADGAFRVSLLNPGSWSVKVFKDGFQTFSGNVNVSTNDTRGLNVKLPATAQATVTVIGTQTAVDPSSNVQGLNVNMEQMAAVPKGRDFSSVAYFAPGVVDSGGFGGNSPSMGGGSAAENSYVIDGLDTKDYRYGFAGTSLKTDFIDQVSVQTGGFQPEFSALGGVIVAVTKSGTNDFTGSAWGTWDAVGIHAAPKKSAWAIQDAASSRYDIGAEVGGAFIKDKLFYFAGVDGEFLEGNKPLANNDPGLVGDASKTSNLQFIGKVNWFITQDMQLSAFGNYNRTKFDQDTAYPLYGTANIGDHFTTDVYNLNLSYDWNISSNLLLSAKLGYTDNKTVEAPSDIANQVVVDYSYYDTGNATTNGAVRRPDLADSGIAFRGGGFDIYTPLEEGKTTQAKVDLSWFIGSHTLKFGLNYLESKYSLKDQQGGPASPNSATGNAARFVVFPGSGVMYSQENHTNAEVTSDFNGIYAQDTWELVPGLRLMYGARYEEQTLKDFTGKTFAKFSGSDYIEPRVGFTYDVNNDGKTVVSGSYATYFEQIPQRLSIRVFANEVFLRKYYTSANFSYAYTGGGMNPNVVITNPTAFYRTRDFATPFSFDPIADGTKLTQRQEYTLGADHAFDSGWTVGAHGTYRHLKNVIEDSVITNKFGSYYDSGVAYQYTPAGVPTAWAGQAILWNPGPSASWTARTSPNSLNSGAHFAIPNTLFDKAGNNYYALNFTASKRTDRDFVNFNYTWSRLEGSYEGLVSSSNGQPDANITASFDYYPYVGYGLLPLDRTNVVKMQYSHRFTLADNDLNLGFAWTYQSGTPLSLFDDGSYTNGHPEGYDTNNVVTNNPADPGHPYVLNPDGSYSTFYDVGYYGNATPANGQLGQFGRSPSTNDVDMHLDYQIKAGAKLRVTPSVDIFNLFNVRQVTGINDLATNGSGLANPYYGHETGWQDGRAYRFGVKVQF